MPGPAPPLPPGPPPPGSAYAPQSAQDQAAAAHAAAWAAYYQSQGYSAPAGPPQANASATPNPYANYGYGAGAQHAGYQPQPPPQQHQQQAGPSTYRPPPPPQAHAPPAQYGPQVPQGYQPHQPVRPPFQQAPPPQQQQQQQYGQPQQSGYGWGQPQQQQQQQQPPAGRPPHQPAQGFRPPQPPQTPYAPRPPQQQQQPFRPQPPQPPIQRPPYQATFQQSHQPGFRPSPSPTPPPTRPFPQARPPVAGIGRPPMGMGMAAVPPAKRPRFDGPGTAMRPPTRPAMGINNGQPGFPTPTPPAVPVRPAHPSIPRGPSRPTPPTSVQPPIVRPPIHLGTGGPPPIPFAGLGGGVRLGARGVVGAPRGPSGKSIGGLGAKDERRKRAERERQEREREKEKEREAKTTMTDWRIVGVAIAGLGWGWGLRGGQTEGEQEEGKTKVKVENGEKVNEGEGKDEGKTDAKEDEPTEAVKEEAAQREENGDDAAEVEVKVEAGEDETAASESVEEKRGEKRKAKTPDGDDDNAPRKRPGDYLVTHGKPNPLTSASSSLASLPANPTTLAAASAAKTAPAPSASHDSNQNRFRIYFESPPELDRIPKAARRNPNKRWRRESTVGSVATAAGGKGREMTVGSAVEEEAKPDAEVRVEEPAQAADVAAEGEVAETEETVPAELPAETGEAVAPLVELPSNGEVEAGAQPTETAPEDTAPVEAGETEAATGEEVAATEDLGDVSMITDSGLAAVLLEEPEPTISDEAPVEPQSGATEPVEIQQPDTPAEPAVDPVSEAPAPVDPPTAGSVSPTKLRARRHSSASTNNGEDNGDDDRVVNEDIVQPSTNRLSILYEGSSRRICLDAAVVESVKVWRKEGRIEVGLKGLPESGQDKDTVKGGEEGTNGDVKVTEEEEVSKRDDAAQMPKGILVEMYDPSDQRFVSVPPSRLGELWSADPPSDTTLPPIHRSGTTSGELLTLTVYLNTKRPLSEPKWCRTNSADEWLCEQFGVKKAGAEGGWKGKLQVMDPDPAPTLQSILDSWASSSSSGTPPVRRQFVASLLASPFDTLEILLRLTRGDRVPSLPTLASSSSSSSLGTLNLRPDSPYASHQTHVSLAILAMYRLTTDYAVKAGVQNNEVEEKVVDIIKSLPVGMIGRSLEGMFREWLEGKK